MPVNAWKIEVKNTTERMLEAQGEMAAAISERKHTNWKRIMPGETITFDTGARAVINQRCKMPSTMHLKMV